LLDFEVGLFGRHGPKNSTTLYCEWHKMIKGPDEWSTEDIR
jgi:hypothetical protein